MLIPPLNWGLVEKGLSRSAVPLSLHFDFLTQQRIRTVVWMRDEAGHSGPAAAAAEQAFSAFLSANKIELIQLGGTKTEEDDDDDDDEAGEQQLRDAAVSAAVGPKDASGSAPSSNPPMTKQPSSSSIASAASSSAAGSWKPTSEALVLQALRVVLDPRAYPLHLVCSGSGRHRTGVVVGCFRKLQRWALSSIFSEYRRYAGSTGLRGADDVGSQLVMNEQFIELFDIELLQPHINSKAISKHLKTIHVPMQQATANNSAAAAQSQQATAKEDGAQQQRRLHAAVQSQIAAAAASSARTLAPAAAAPSPAPASTSAAAPAANAAATALTPPSVAHTPRPAGAPADALAAHTPATAP